MRTAIAGIAGLLGEHGDIVVSVAATRPMGLGLVVAHRDSSREVTEPWITSSAIYEREMENGHMTRSEAH